MKTATVLAIMGKELRDTLRDRRALFVSLVLPILLYPVLLIGFVRVAAGLKESLDKEVFKLWTLGPGELPKALKEGFAEAERKFEIAPCPPEWAERLEEALRESETQLVLRLPEDFRKNLEGGSQARVTLVYQRSAEKSRLAFESTREVLRRYASGLRRARLEALEVPREAIEPLILIEDNQGRRHVELLRSLAMMLVILGVTGAFYPALDLGAGEKERGTLETLLLTPATRMELAAGKYLAVLVIAMAAGLLNVGSLAGSFLQLGAMAPSGALGEDLQISLDLTTIGSLLLVLTPLIALFSALALAVSTYAASYKEGQNYLSPVMLAVMVPAMAAGLPGLELDATRCITPVMGASLLLREVLAGAAFPWQVGLVVGAHAFYALLSIRWVASLYSREDVLMRPAAAGQPLFPGLARLGTGSAAAWRALPAPLQPPPAEPGAVQAILVWAVTLASSWFIASRLGIGQVLWSALLPAFFAMLCAAALPFALGLDLPQSLRLRRCHWIFLVIAALLGFSLFGLRLTLLHGSGGALAKLGGNQAELMMAALQALQQIRELGTPAGVLLLGVLPALSEATLLQGFVQTGLSKELGLMIGVPAAAVFAALLGFSPESFLPTFISALVAGSLVWYSGSLWPALILGAVERGTLLWNTLPTDVDLRQRWLIEFQIKDNSSEVLLSSTGLTLCLLAAIAALTLGLYFWRRILRAGELSSST